MSLPPPAPPPAFRRLIILTLLAGAVVMFLSLFVTRHMTKSKEGRQTVWAKPPAAAAVDPAAQPGPKAGTDGKSRPTPASAGKARSGALSKTTAAPLQFDVYPRPVTSWFEAQIALARQVYSCGSIDGIAGVQTVRALRAFQENEGLSVTGRLDDLTRPRLELAAPPLTQYVVSAEDLARLQPLSPTWLGKSQQSALDYETVLELVAERAHAHPKLLLQLNPDVNWDKIIPGTELTVPALGVVSPRTKAVCLYVRLADNVLEARDENDALIVHFPVSIARNVEKRPVGELHVTVIIPNPDYTFDPAVFPESQEGRQLARRLVVPPGPNNPVGVAWIGLDQPGYGIHGTPDPEKVGRTESHGCFRLANWDALTLLDVAWVGLPVIVAP
ncbi:MAG: L,D-transpeptidase [Opitutaceae bacterium]|nr:L,D-transpeptidase [Opitutaceae bacterium]